MVLLRFQMKLASGVAEASGQERDPSSQGSKPCWRARRVILWLHSIRFDFPMSRIRFSSQEVPVRVQTVSQMPLDVTPK